MERKGERVGGVNENGSVFGWREWRDGGDHAGQRIIEENSKREREKRLSERRVLGVEGRTECEKCGERGGGGGCWNEMGLSSIYINLCKSG